MEHLLQLIDHYGYFALYGLLALGIVGIPVPDEILMTTVGSLTAAEEPLLSFGVTLAVSFCGAMTGMVVSYILGRKVGKPFLYKYGKWVKLTPERLHVAENWFKKNTACGQLLSGITFPGCAILPVIGQASAMWGFGVICFLRGSAD